MARRSPHEEPSDDLSVGELIDGPTEALTPEILAAAFADERRDVDATQDLSSAAARAGAGPDPGSRRT